MAWVSRHRQALRHSEFAESQWRRSRASVFGASGCHGRQPVWRWPARLNTTRQPNGSPSAPAGLCVVLHCPASVIDELISVVGERRSGSPGSSLLRVVVDRQQATGRPRELMQSGMVGAPTAVTVAFRVRRRPMAPFTREPHWRKFLSWSAASLALATTAQYNKSAQRIAFGDRWPLRCIALSGQHD